MGLGVVTKAIRQWEWWEKERGRGKRERGSDGKCNGGEKERRQKKWERQ